MRPLISEDTLTAISFAVDMLEQNQWKMDEDRHRTRYVECLECDARYYRDNIGMPDEDRKHKDGCRLAQTLTHLNGFLQVEQQLHYEAERANENV